MKKTYKVLGIVAVFMLVTVLSMGVGRAVTITSTVTMEGEGLIDRTVDVQTAEWYEGSKYYSDLRTPYLGKYGESEVYITEEICVRGGNESEITVNGKYRTGRVYHKVDIMSYDVGSRFNFENTGSEWTKHKLYVNENESDVYIEGSVECAGRWSMTAREPGAKLKEFRDVTDYEGKFDMLIVYKIERVTHSEPVSDWLGCP